VPRNPPLPRTTTKALHLGICDARPPARTISGSAACLRLQHCGNVAHAQGVLPQRPDKVLREAIEFYNTRDTSPERWIRRSKASCRIRYCHCRFSRHLDEQGPLDGRAAAARRR